MSLSLIHRDHYHPYFNLNILISGEFTKTNLLRINNNKKNPNEKITMQVVHFQEHWSTPDPKR